MKLCSITIFFQFVVYFGPCRDDNDVLSILKSVERIQFDLGFYPINTYLLPIPDCTGDFLVCSE